MCVTEIPSSPLSGLYLAFECVSNYVATCLIAVREIIRTERMQSKGSPKG